MVCLDTLRIKHLPKELSEAQKEDFVRHFGAVNVKVITSKAKAKSIVYAKFENADVAKNVLFRLHQLAVLNCRLSVEYAETDVLQGAPTGKRVSEINDVPDKKFFRNFINSINAFNDSVGFHQPPPSHLKYNYPKANRSTINNIAHALATVPRFYTQVLHLMNKMNLPPPFAMPEPPVRVIQPTQHPVVAQKPPEIVSEKRRMSSSESEIESDGESNKNNEIIPQKRTMSQKRAVKRPKFIKQPVIQSSAVSKPAEKPEDVFERVEVQQMKKIELRVMPELPPEPPKQIPVQRLTPQTNVEQKPTPQKIVEQKPPQKNVEQKPTLQKNVEQKPTLQKNVEQKPTPQKYVEQKPTPQKNVEQKPTPQKYVEQKPTPQKNVEEKPTAQKPTPQKHVELKPTPQTNVDKGPSPEKNVEMKTTPQKNVEQRPSQTNVDQRPSQTNVDQRPSPQKNVEQRPSQTSVDQRPSPQKNVEQRPSPHKNVEQKPTIPEQPKVIDKDEPNIVKQNMPKLSKEPEKRVSQSLTHQPPTLEKSQPKDKSPPTEKTIVVSREKIIEPLNQKIPPKVVEKLDQPSCANTQHINPIPKSIDTQNMNPIPKPVEMKKCEKEGYQTKDQTIQPTATTVEETVNNSSKLQLEKQSQQQEKLVKEPREKLEVRAKPLEMLLPLPQVLEDPGSPDDEFPCISLEELAANQVTDLSVMPVFKNYNPGEPTNKLYIKNCAKTVAVQDLEYIYNRYREEGTEDTPSEFNIRLMKEGRMKGQAFVTLDSVEMAQKAVKETNGFILKDKPLVVVFGKAGKKK